MVGEALAGVSVLGGIALYVIRAEMRGELARLDGRANTQEALHKELKEDVTYIRERIDRAINGHGK